MGVSTEVKFLKNNEIEHSFSELLDLVYTGSPKQLETELKKNLDFSNIIVLPTNQSLLSTVLAIKPINYDMLDVLMKYSVSLNHPINVNGESPIEQACKTRDLKLLTYLVEHGAHITEAAAHKLLYKAKDIKMMSLTEILQLHKMIDLLGGMKTVAEMNDKTGQTFKSNARKSRLVNSRQGILRYDLWYLLNLADKMIQDHSENQALIDQITLLNARFTEKENTDKRLGRSLVSLYRTSGDPIDISDEPSLFPSRL